MDNKTFGIAILVLVVLGLGSASVVYTVWSGSDDIVIDEIVPVEDVDDICSITYFTNGGRLEGDFPDRYVPGTYVVLPSPENGDKWFDGWFIDPGFENPIGAITPSMTGDMVLYGSWSDFSIYGSGFLMDSLVEYGSGADRTSVRGTMSWSYLTWADGASYVERTVSWDGGDSSTDGYWTDEVSGSDFKYVGNEEIDGRMCEIWSDGTETQWIHKSWLCVKIEYISGTNHHLYTLKEELSFEPELKFTPDLRASMGVHIEGPTSLTIGEDVTYTASGRAFGGWYLDGELVSEDRRITFERVDPTMVFEACTFDPYTVFDGPISPSDLGFSGEVTIFNEDSDEVVAGVGPFELEPGFYTMWTVIDDVAYYSEFFVEDDSAFVHMWRFQGRDYVLFQDLKYSEVYRDSYKDRGYRVGMGQDMDSRFLSPDCAYVREVSERLTEMSEGMDPITRAGFVLTFVQTMHYLTDMSTRGESEYWKYPAETLWDDGGDCEDSSILYASIMSCMGYDTCIAVFSTHAMAGIVLEHLTVPHDSFVHEGRTYVFAETTSTSLGLWRTTPDFDENDIYYVVTA